MLVYYFNRILLEENVENSIIHKPSLGSHLIPMLLLFLRRTYIVLINRTEKIIKKTCLALYIVANYQIVIYNNHKLLFQINI